MHALVRAILLGLPGVDALVHDPMADERQIAEDFGIELSPLDELNRLDVLIYAVPHSSYVEMDIGRFNDMVAPGGALVDIKSSLDPASLREDIRYWSL